MKLKSKTALFLTIFLGISIGVLIKVFILDIILINGESMEPNFHAGQIALVNRMAYGLNRPFSDVLMTSWSSPKIGDVVIYMIDDIQVIKRCVAVEGDLLEYSSDSGYNLTVEGRSFPLTEEQFHRMKDFGSVPEGTVMTIGDNHDVSIDSRTYGFVSVKNILGKVICKPTDF